MIPALTNHIWQSMLFAVVAGLLTMAFRGNRAQVRYWLWCSASLKYFVPFSLLIGLGSNLRWAPATQQMATQIATPEVSFRMEQLAQPFSGVQPVAPSMPATRDW